MKIYLIFLCVTRFDFVWMQTQKSPNDPHIRIPACGCKFHHYQPIPYFKILLDIYFHWNRRPLTIWRFCWQPFWNWWPRKNDPECKFHHYQPIPHFKILLDINFHWNRDRWQFDDFVGSHFEIGGLVKMTLNANCIITNQFLTSKYS